MNAAEKIKDFESVSSLMEEIQKDRACKDILAQRYPVRFIMLDNFETFRELSNELTIAGIDTFTLNGRGLSPLVKAGDSVTAGQPLMEMDLNLIRNAGLSPMIITVLSNS